MEELCIDNNVTFWMKKCGIEMTFINERFNNIGWWMNEMDVILYIWCMKMINNMDEKGNNMVI